MSVLTVKERFIQAIHFKQIDVIPVMCNKRAMGPQLIGRKFDRDLFLDGEILAKAELALWEEVQDDVFNIGATPALQEALGCDLMWPENDHPQFGRATIKTREDAEKLEIPDPYKNAFMSALLEEVRLLKKWAGDQVIFEVSSHGIFNTVSRLTGVERMMTAIRKDREFLDILLNKAVDTTLCFAQALKEAGADLYGIGDAMCSPAVLSPKVFKEYVIPFVQRQMRGLKEIGLIAQFHPCGGEYPIIDQMQYTGADIFHFSELVDLDVAQKIFYRRFAVSGGVDPTNTLYLGTPEFIDQNIKELIGKLKHKNGVIIQPGCGLSTNIPIENLKAMVKAVRKYSELAGRREI